MRRRRDDEGQTADSVRKRRYSGGDQERGTETSSRVPERTSGIEEANMDFNQELDDVDIEDIEETTGAHQQEMTAGDDLSEQMDAEADAYAGSNLDEASMDELQSIADELDVDDYHEMSRDELVREIRSRI